MAKSDNNKTSDYPASVENIISKIKKAFNDFAEKVTGYKFGVGEEGYDNVEPGEEDAASAKSFIEELRDMEADYITRKAGVSFPDPDEVLPTTLGGKTLEYVEKSDEELAKEAENELMSNYVSKVGNAEENRLAKLDTLEAKRAALEEEEEAKRASLKSATEQAHRSYTDDMIRQGLVNSTIMSYGNSLIDDMQAETYEKYDKEYDLKYNEIRAKIDETELAYNNAIKEYDYKYAADLEAKIAKLRTAEESRLKAINEYNRKLAEREANYQQKRTQKIAEMQNTRIKSIIDAALAEKEEEERTGIISAEKQSEYARRMAAAKEFYAQYDPKLANSMIMLSESELVPLLGNNSNYLALLGWNNAR